MARTIRVHLTDDLDNTPADETVTFALDGIAYDIDLNATHADELRRTAAPYIVAGRRTPRGTIIGSRRTAGAAASDRHRNHTIRAWAERNGIQLNGRGRIPADIAERYDKESSH